MTLVFLLLGLLAFASGGQLIPSKLTMTIRKGDVFRHVLAGGGGWGDPLEREAQAVLRDVRNEYLSAERARADYGVVVDTMLQIAREAAEAPELLHDAPHSRSVRRLDEVRAAKDQIVRHVFPH